MHRHKELWARVPRTGLRPSTYLPTATAAAAHEAAWRASRLQPHYGFFASVMMEAHCRAHAVPSFGGLNSWESLK